jgi:hypothetical protein
VLVSWVLTSPSFPLSSDVQMVLETQILRSGAEDASFFDDYHTWEDIHNYADKLVSQQEV